MGFYVKIVLELFYLCQKNISFNIQSDQYFQLIINSLNVGNYTEYIIDYLVF